MKQVPLYFQAAILYVQPGFGKGLFEQGNVMIGWNGGLAVAANAYAFYFLFYK